MIACSDCAQVFRAKRFSVVPKHAVICVPDSTSLNPNDSAGFSRQTFCIMRWLRDQLLRIPVVALCVAAVLFLLCFC
jgi:hypothetical protein